MLGGAKAGDAVPGAVSGAAPGTVQRLGHPLMLPSAVGADSVARQTDRGPPELDIADAACGRIAARVTG